MIMNRKWYKNINGEWVEAPQQVETENGVMYNYNSDANEKMLREDGYLPDGEVTVTASAPSPTLEQRVKAVEDVTAEVITILNDKGIAP